jgi:hypothetical protein
MTWIGMPSARMPAALRDRRAGRANTSRLSAGPSTINGVAPVGTPEDRSEPPLLHWAAFWRHGPRAGVCGTPPRVL